MKTLSTPTFLFGKSHGKKIWLPLIFCVASLNIFATTTLSLEMPPVETCESCSIPGTTPQTFTTGAHAVIYAGRYYDTIECKTYFFYCTINDGGTGGHDISNTSFGDVDCSNTCLQTTSLSTLGGWALDHDNNFILNDACGTIEYGTDPNTGICGVKHDEGSEGACYVSENCSGIPYLISHLYLAIEGNIPEGTVTIGIKFGTTYETLEIPGPGDCQDEGCIDLDPILEVALLNFSAVKGDQGSILKWVTALEINNDYFEVQRSIDNKNFITIGTVKGSGNSTSERSYEYTDNYPNAGINAYRLRQVDMDGRATVSQIRMVSFIPSQDISLFPNPTVNELTVRLANWDRNIKTTFRVIDFNGAEVLSQEVTSGTTRLNVAQLPVGTYFIEVTNLATTQTYRFIKS